MNHWNEANGMLEGPGDCFSVNPATGLPMMDSMFDVEGNPFGSDISGLATGRDSFGIDPGTSHTPFATDSFEIGGFGSDW